MITNVQLLCYLRGRELHVVLVLMMLWCLCVFCLSSSAYTQTPRFALGFLFGISVEKQIDQTTVQEYGEGKKKEGIMEKEDDGKEESIRRKKTRL